MKKSDFPFTPFPTEDQVGKDKGKEKVSERTIVVARSYTTMGTEKNLLSDGMTASKQKYVYKKRQRKTTVVKEYIPEDHIVNVEEEKEIDWTESEEELGDLSQGPKKVKDSKVQKKDIVKGKKSDPISNRGPGSQIRSRKIE